MVVHDINNLNNTLFIIMVKVRVKEGLMSLPANRYRGYLFLANQWLEIKDKDDIEYFKSHPELFEIQGLKEKVKEAIGIKTEKKAKYTREELEKMSFMELKEIGRKFGTTDRSKERLIEEILALQEKKEEKK
mgnify:CR=1 FL=1